ncbi:O-antigen ligase family protein [Candidatus Falkowbacteria bacterium]|nr:O-antigen ligase family protein [Candidatus Falkowbacteria bacterium]
MPALLLVAGLAVLNFGAVNFVQLKYVLLFDLALIVLALFCRWPEIGLYSLIVFYPFVNWQFRIGEVNLPYVDLAAVFLLSAVLLKTIWQLTCGEKLSMTWHKTPGVVFAMIFWLAASFSLINNDVFGPAFKYWLRPIVFFYLMFVILPFNLIDSNKKLKNILQLFFAVGIFVAFSGLLSVIFGVGPWYQHRAVPFSFADFNPLGGNHNAVAEVLAAVIPLTFILYLLSEKIKARGWYMLAIFFMALILILTFSRSGWLALMVELLILLFYKYHPRINRLAYAAVALTLIFAVAISYLTIWQNISWVQSSNANRILMTKIAFNGFLEQPLIGNGLNTFQQIVGRTFVYRVEFADPLESHGFVQKLSTETGVLGLGSFIALICFMLYYCFKAYQTSASGKARQIVLCFIMTLSGLVVFELFSTSYFLATMWLPIGVCLAGVSLNKK